MGDDEKVDKIPNGRLSRLARMAQLGARTATDVAIGRARQALGADASALFREETARRILDTLGTMKAAAMKLGQQLAMEADQLPPEAREVVARLFSQAPPMAYEQIAAVVQEELGDPPERAFAEFDREPVAAASLGQVHRARLQDGTPVAVKVQYPGVAEALLADLRNAGLLVRAFGGAGRAATGQDPQPYYEEIRREIGAETDYLREARLAAQYAHAVRDRPELHVPRVFAAYSTARILTMELAQGPTLQQFAAAEPSPEERFRVGRLLGTAVFAPFVTHRLVHADPHPGNFVVRPDGRLTVLDFGAVKRFSAAFVRAFSGLMFASLDGREPDYDDLLLPAGFGYGPDVERTRRVMARVHALAARPVTSETYDWGACRIVPDFKALALEHPTALLGVRTPPESILFYRAVAGLASNLRLLKARGPWRAHAAWIMSLPPAEGPDAPAPEPPGP